MIHNESQKDQLIDLLFKQIDHQHRSMLFEVNREQALKLFKKLFNTFRKSVFFSQDRYFLVFKDILKQYPDFVNLSISKEKLKFFLTDEFIVIKLIIKILSFNSNQQFILH